MKYAIKSILFALFGIGFVIYLNFELAELYELELYNDLKTENELAPNIFIIGKLNKVITLLIAVIAMALGVKSVQLKNRIGLVGILLSAILMVLTFIPIWQYI
ncbi:hypothetical protein [Psychroserpens luteus]|uniref:DUF3784 domain-containing protein n=1 Tax=Psychroserpens luteus TaxID=1434066 RepID=A0ABW5ZSZ3_9FLAO|nr:hypothetical protein [Psychroserpens luteus]